MVVRDLTIRNGNSFFPNARMITHELFEIIPTPCDSGTPLDRPYLYQGLPGPPVIGDHHNQHLIGHKINYNCGFTSNRLSFQATIVNCNADDNRMQINTDLCSRMTGSPIPSVKPQLFVGVSETRQMQASMIVFKFSRWNFWMC